jgi:hypothetical protein
VARINGRAKVGRKRGEQEYIRADKDRPENAIIDRATWEAAQARTKAIAATPRAERRPNSGELYYSGLLYCGDCDKPMTAWRQVQAYRCSTNAKLSTMCRCNRTPHDLIEEIVIHHLERAERGIGWLRAGADESLELFLLAEESDAPAREFTREFTRM